MADACLETFSAAQDGQICLIVIPITVAEVIRVLESFYNYPKDQIAVTVTEFLHSEGLEVVNLDILIQALSLCHEKNIDFADELLGAHALRHGPNLIYSFDRDFSWIPGITRLELVKPITK